MKRIILTLLIAWGGILSSSAATYIWSGDSSSWIESSSDYPADKKVYTIDKAYSQAELITSIGAGSWIDFGAAGSVGPVNDNGFGLSGKKFKFNATLDMNIDQSEAGGVAVGSFVLETRWLLTGNDIWNREGVNGSNYVDSFCLGLNRDVMNKLETGIVDSLGALTEFKEGVGNYRFIVVKDKGVGVQYSRQVTAAVPEPTTAALGLLGLVGLGRAYGSPPPHLLNSRCD